MRLRDLVPSASNSVDAEFILLEMGQIYCTRRQKLQASVTGSMDKTKTSKGAIEETRECLALVADESACVNFLLWNSECEAFEPGDILHLTNGIFSYHRQKLVLRSGRKGRTERVGEFTMLFVESPNMSEISFQTAAEEPGPGTSHGGNLTA
ncbi:nucleic acid-binding, OB-fold-like protein [Wolffia australiana]